MEMFQIFSTEFDQNNIVKLGMLTDEVNSFIKRTPQVKKVDWLQTPEGPSKTRLTAVITYIVMVNGGY